MMPWGNYGWGMGMGFGWLFMIVFWMLVIAGIVFIVRLVAGGEKRNPEETALDILKKRYARGEISKEEFEEKKKAIE